MKKHIFISGRVQGVGFRHFTKSNATTLGVRGWVRNLADGRVEAVFEGTEKNVAELVEWCSKGPTAAYVENIEVMDVKDESEFDEFRVKL